ncbi:MAG: glyoxalase [Solirubrobacteraceae bacterium]
MADLVALEIADEPETWAAIGFAVQDGRAVLGGVALDLVGRDRGDGILGWTLGTAVEAPLPGPPHPNGALALDHVVMTAADFERTLDELLADGLDLRRERDDLRDNRMAFFRAGPTIVELVGAPGGETRLWGLVAVVPSVDEPHPALAPHLGEPRDAVQPGRRIATLRPSAGIGTAAAFMTPRPGP